MNRDPVPADPRLLDLAGTTDQTRYCKVAMIVADPNHAEVKRREMNERGLKHIIVFFPGQCIAGYRFSTVLLSSNTYAAIHSDERSVAWWNENLRCRLDIHGQIIVIP